MESAVRLVRLIQVAMLVSIAMYGVVGEMAARPTAPNKTFYYAISFISISLVGAVLVVRKTLVLHSEAQLREKPDDDVILARWKAGHILTYALCEALALFGLVLRLLGFTLGQVWYFYLGGFALLLFFTPRAPQSESDASA